MKIITTMKDPLILKCLDSLGTVTLCEQTERLISLAEEQNPNFIFVKYSDDLKWLCGKIKDLINTNVILACPVEQLEKITVPPYVDDVVSIPVSKVLLEKKLKLFLNKQENGQLATTLRVESTLNRIKSLLIDDTIYALNATVDRFQMKKAELSIRVLDLIIREQQIDSTYFDYFINLVKALFKIVGSELTLIRTKEFAFSTLNQEEKITLMLVLNSVFRACVAEDSVEIELGLEGLQDNSFVIRGEFIKLIEKATQTNLILKELIKNKTLELKQRDRTELIYCSTKNPVKT